MKIIISPAKSLNFDIQVNTNIFTQNEFANESKKLVNKLKKMSKSKLAELMKLSPQLTDLNYSRYKNWELPFTTSNAKQAGFVFTGEVYRGLDFETLPENKVLIAQEKLRILSGLYGILKPLDLIQPYRLEMGTKLIYNSKTENLYKFWDNKITDYLNKELNNGVLVNLASKEYFKVIKTKQLNGKIITCNFKDYKNGSYKTIMTYAKNARGKMARFIINNNINNQEEIKTFDLDGYIYNPSLSLENEYIFTRG